MNLLYISLPEILVLSDAYYFFENIVNMKKIGKILIIRHLWLSDKMVALRRIYSRTTIGMTLSYLLPSYLKNLSSVPISLMISKRLMRI